MVRCVVPLADADWRYAKEREFFFFLLTQPRATKEQLGLALYLDVSPSHLRARLHRVLYYARHALGRSDWILFENDEYAFNRERLYWFDVEQFEQRVRAAQAALATSLRDTPLAIRLLQDATPLYTGDFFCPNSTRNGSCFGAKSCTVWHWKRFWSWDTCCQRRRARRKRYPCTSVFWSWTITSKLRIAS